jgi:spermidine synthase
MSSDSGVVRAGAAAAGSRSQTFDAARSLPWLLLLFAGSGCSALIYEIVWFQLLQLAIGSTSVSLGFLLATFMGGLCLGSLALPRLQSLKQEHPLRVYAALEFGIGLFGIFVLFALPFIDRVYVVGAESGLPGMVLRGVVSAICLLPPTILMGASLPAIVRGIQSTPRGVSWWSLLYGANLAGAIFGTLFAGFYLLRIYNMATATYVAVAINFAVATISFALAGLEKSRDDETTVAASAEQSAAPAEDPSMRRSIYVGIALSGATALGAQIVWTRLMGMLLGSTTYVFSIILAVFLVGLAIGSAVAAGLVRQVRPRLALGWCQLLLTLATAWSAIMLYESLPYWPINPLLSLSPWYIFQLDVVRCCWAMLPATILWGASFPLALAAVASPDEDSGKTVGAVYAANTFGAILGALTVSLILVPWIGTQQTERVLLLASAASALIVLLPHLRVSPSRLAEGGLAAAVILAGLLAWRIGPIPGILVEYGRKAPIQTQGSQIIDLVEGRNSSAAIAQWSDGTIGLGVNGHVQASNIPYDMKLQRMVGHLPLLLHPDPKSVLGIGFGAGVTAGTFTTYPGIEKITICEIEPRIPPLSTKHFSRENYGVMNNPKTRIVYDDARHYLMTTRDKFDVIASDPLDVFAKGTAALYTKEYFDAIKAHLNPGGYFSLYVPLYETDLRTIKSELATFFASFPNGTIWANTINGSGYDMVFMGQAEPLKIDLDETQRRLERSDYSPVAESLRGIGIGSLIDLLSTFTGQASDFAPWVQGSELNRDLDLRLQYLAGWGINSTIENDIFQEMLGYRKPPENLFTGSPLLKNSLMALLGPPQPAETQ